MSVINNVLKSLEDRESQFTPLQIPALEGGAAKKARRGGLVFAFLIVLLLAAAAAAAAGYYFFNPERDVALTVVPPTDSETALTPAEPEATPLQVSAAILSADTVAAEGVTAPAADEAMLEPVAAVVPETTPNQIIGLDLRESETEMRLEFVLRERVAAYLRERGERSFGYHLRDVESDIAAPVMRNNRWLQRLEIRQRDGGVDINFTTTAGILVEADQQTVDGETAWVIHLRQPKVTATVATAPAKPEPAPEPAPSTETESPVVEQSASAEVEESAPVTLDIKATNPEAKSASKIDYAVELMNAGRADDAEALLLELIGGSQDYAARKHLIALYSLIGKPARERSLLLESIREYPLDNLFRSEYARLLFANGSYREVITLLDAAPQQDVVQQTLLAASYQRLDRHQEAIRHYEIALRQDKRNARNWVGLGISQEHDGQFEAALDSYSQASLTGDLNNRLQSFVERRRAELEKVVD